jgi:hypothetical protein
MRSMLIAAVAALAFAGAAQAAPHCVKGKACGNSCIKATDVCHKPTPAVTPPVVPPKHCKDPKTHKFVKCGTAGAVPA